MRLYLQIKRKLRHKNYSVIHLAEKGLIYIN